MEPSLLNDAFARAVDPVLGILDQQQVREIADYHADAALQQRIEHLAIKANEGNLSESELAEYEGYAQANSFVAVLQAQARRKIATSP